MRQVVKRHVEIVEVGPRDGLQHETVTFSLEAKQEFVGRMVAAGIRRLEVASFVNPKRVPQMADADALMKSLPTVAGVTYIGLVMNRRGFDRAVAAGCAEIGMVVVASNTFNQRNQGVTTEQSLITWREIARAAHAAGVRPQVTVSAAFGCPFEGEVPVERVIDLAKRVAQDGPSEIAFADTIGVAVPSQVSALIEDARNAVPGVSLRCHFHNTRNTGIANAYAALTAGVSTLDASLGGIGGCPFAPAATGNIPTEDLVYMLQRMGIDTGVNLDQLLDSSRWMQTQLGRTVPGLVVKAGGFPRPAGAAQ